MLKLAAKVVISNNRTTFTLMRLAISVLPSHDMQTIPLLESPHTEPLPLGLEQTVEVVVTEEVVDIIDRDT